MALSSLIRDLAATPELGQLSERVSRVRAARPLSVSDVGGAARLATVAALIHTVRVPVLIITSRQDVAEQVTATLAEYLDGSSLDVRLWPVSESLPYEMVPIDRDASARRVEILQSLHQREPSVTVAAARAMTQMLSSPGELSAQSFTLKIGEQLDVEQFLSRMLSLGYQMVKLVREPGQISRRGGIIDIFPPSESYGIRLDLFGDEIDSLRHFDPETQRSIERINQISIRPPLEHALVNRESSVTEIRKLDTSDLRD
ncbi:MAG: hypothetical protein WD401_02330, partial [Thermomicrobiaceae bacterium]